MKDNFFKFPSTPHLAALPDVDIRGDKVFSESERHEFLKHHLVVEEKIDGANLGISFDSEGNIRTQNRGAYLYPPRLGQWKKLGDCLRVSPTSLYFSENGAMPSTRFLMIACLTGFLASIFTINGSADFFLRNAGMRS